MTMSATPASALAVTTRLATVDDLDDVTAMMRKFYAHFGYAFREPGASAAPSQRDLIERFVTTPHLGSFWLIEVDGAPAGYAALTYGFSFEFGGRDAFVDELFVDEAVRGRGAGATALQQLQARASALGLVAIHLQTEAYNPRAKRLYESVGFVDLKRSTLTWRPPGT